LGAKPVLVTCSFGMVLSPVWWTLAGPDRLWPLAVDAVLSGLWAAGHGLAAFALPLAVAPKGERPFYHASFAMAGGAAYGLAAAAGGAVAQAASPWVGGTWVALHVTFVASAAARLLAATSALRIEEPGAQPLAALARMVRASVARLVPRSNPPLAVGIEHAVPPPDPQG
ncbi:MAG TPA: MFS transporter, partial [Myxococcaceae bacterium]|nr:MFS transporter [Myxococcaceae bacterium]